MKSRVLYFISCLASMLCLVSCDGTIAPSQPSLVVDGWIDSDGYPVVVLTKTIVPDASDRTPVSDCLVRWGKVTVSDGEREVVLTGTTNEDYFPPYIYRTYEMRGVPGKTYDITASYDGMKVTASCKMPPSASITRLTSRKIQDSDSLCEITLGFLPAPGERNYHILTRIHGSNGRFLPSFMGAVKTDGSAETVTVPVYAPKTDTSPYDFSPHFKLGDTVDVALCTVTADVYDFWLGYDDEVAFGGNQFVSSAGNLRSNIKGGYGVWSAQGVVRRTIIVTP